MRFSCPTPADGILWLKSGQEYHGQVLKISKGGQTVLHIDGFKLVVASHSLLKVGDTIRFRVEKVAPRVVFKLMARKNEREQDFEVRI